MKWLHPSILQLPQTPLKALCFLIDGFATTFGKNVISRSLHRFSRAQLT